MGPELTDPLRSLSDRLVQLVRSVSPTVVGLEHRRGSGSGIILSPDGYLLTNAHVVASSPSVTVRFQDGEDTPGQILGTDPKTDLAVVRVDAVRSLSHALLIDKREVQVGQIVLAMGNPLRFERSVSWGIVSAIDRTLPSPHGALEGLIQTDAAINPGNSGGPLVATTGEIVGINTAIIPQASGLGFAVPAYTASWVVAEIIRKGRVERRYLGIAAQGVDIPAAPRPSRAVYVHQVEPGSPAERGDLRAGDLLTRADGRELWNLDDLQRVLTLGHSRLVAFELFRKKVKIYRSVQLLEGPIAA